MATRVAKIVVNILVLAGIVVLGVFAFIWLAPDAQSSDSSTCRPPGKGVTSTPKPPRKQREKATLTVAEGATTYFDLGLDVNSGVRTIPFVLTTPLWGRDRLQVSPGTFAPAKQDGRPLGPTAVKVWAVLDRSGNTGTAYLCISPGARERAPWGTFSGNLMFEDSRLEPTTVPITVTASYPRIHIVAVVGLAVCLLANLYVFFLRDGTDREPRRCRRGRGAPMALRVCRALLALHNRDGRRPNGGLRTDRSHCRVHRSVPQRRRLVGRRIGVAHILRRHRHLVRRGWHRRPACREQVCASYLEAIPRKSGDA